MLLPASVNECYQFAQDAFDLAERLQTPVFVMTDLDLGMNTWMSKPFDYPSKPFDRGKRLDADKLKQLGEFARYRDVDGDGIPYRTVPGDGGPAFFTRGSGHNDKALYSERADDYTNNLDRLSKKFDTARTLVPKPEVDLSAKGGIGVIAYGTTHWALIESRDQLKNEQKINTSYYRLRGYPFGKELFDFIDTHDRVYVVDQNRDGQMWSLIRLECNPQQVAKLRSIRHYYGLPIDGRSLTTELLKQEGRL
jgi:2-oxoglutarate ferredoxin oxidoreductase subunit alpha